MNAGDTSVGQSAMAPVREIIDEAQQIIDRQFGTLRQELRDELQKGREAALELGLGAGMSAVGGILMGLMAVHAVHRATGLPLWLSHGLVGGLLGIGGVQLMASGKQRIAQMSELPAQALESSVESVADTQRLAAPTVPR